MPYEHIIDSVRVHGVGCSHCSAGWESVTAEASDAIDMPCPFCQKGVYREFDRVEEIKRRVPVCACGSYGHVCPKWTLISDTSARSIFPFLMKSDRKL